MEASQISAHFHSQKTFFASGATRPLCARMAALRRLRDAIRRREGEICDALRQDLGKSPGESYMCEVGLCYSEITFQLRHMRAFAGKRRVPTPLAHFPARSFTRASPKGVCLILSPWNYPFLLAVEPLVDALAAGNTAILKPSEYAPHTARVLESLVAECFDPAYVTLIPGAVEESRMLLELPFDHIFFTGSGTVGRQVMAKAAEHLTPVTLELGGKSPCIVDRSADIPLAARRIVFGKFLNCGQTCVAPDYILCDEAVHDHLLNALIDQIRAQYGPAPLENEQYGKIINQKHFDRLTALLGPENVAFGGGLQPERLRIEPTILDGVSWNAPIMGEEIFGPLLPILSFSSLEQALDRINARPRPLALYLFSRNKKQIRQVMENCSFGGGCVNDTIIHLATSHMGFGGVGESGMGSYHGRAGFDTFSHQKSIVERGNWPDLPMRYHPDKPGNHQLIRRFLK